MALPIHKTVGELIDVLAKWPRDTILFFNVAPVMDEPAGEYQWHFGHVFGPSDSELTWFKDHPKEITYTTITLDPKIQGY